MITRTSQPASGAMLISEMKEFAGFPKATQRYIRRSLDVAYGRRDPIECWSRDEGEAASIRAQARLYKQLDHLRLQVPDDSGLDMIEPFIGMLITLSAFDLGQDRLPEFRRLPLPLRAPDRRRGAAVAAGGVLLCRGAAAPSSRPPPGPAPVDQRERCDRARLVEPRAGLLAGVGREGRPQGCRLSRLIYVGSASSSTRQPLDQLLRELDQRVVARAHDQDAVAGLRLGDQRVADVGALGNVLALRCRARRPAGEPVRCRALRRRCRPDRPGRADRGGPRPPCPRRSCRPARSPIFPAGRSRAAGTRSAAGPDARGGSPASRRSCRDCARNRRSP